MSQDVIKQQEEQDQNIFRSVGFAGGTFATCAMVDLFGHFGATGLLMGGMASFLSFKYGPAAYAAAKRQYDHLDPQSKEAIQSVMRRFRRDGGIQVEEEDEEDYAMEAIAQPKDDMINLRIDASDEVCEPVFPSYPDNETIVLGKVVKTGQRFDPHFNQISGKGFVACAVQGSGKSQLMGRIIEQGGKCGAPIIVLDHKGEYPPILDLPFIDGIHAGSAEMAGVPKFFELTLKNVDEFVWMVMEERCVAIVNLPSYGGPDDKWLPKAEIVAAVGKSLMRYAIRQRKLDMANGLPPGSTLLPCWLLLDEAQLYLPQQIDLLPPEARANKDILNEMNNSYFTLVTNGRSAGYTVGFATQSLTYIAKWAIKSCQIRIFARHVERNDLDACEKEIDEKVATREEINMFPPGRAVARGFTLQPMVIQFDKRESKDYSETPGIERLRNPRLTKRSAQPVQRLQSLPDPMVRTMRSNPYPDEVASLSPALMEKIPVVQRMRDAGFSEGEIPVIIGISERNYRLILAEMGNGMHPIRWDAQGSEWEPREKRDHDTPRELTGYSVSGANLSTNAPEQGRSTGLPMMSVISPVEPVGVNRGDSPFTKEDRMMNELQINQFIALYSVLGNIQKCLGKIEGCNNRHSKHASLIVKERGLRKA